MVLFVIAVVSIVMATIFGVATAQNRKRSGAKRTKKSKAAPATDAPALEAPKEPVPALPEAKADDEA